MKVWIIGNQGMLGQELTAHFKEAGLETIGSDREVSILEPEAIEDFYNKNRPDWIINCSAYTAVDKAEEDSANAYLINQQGVANIAELASKVDIPLIHISTDYVFDGTSSSPLKEDASTGPQGVYGASKLAGEEEILKKSKKYFILRTAWLYGKYGPNFVYTMIKLMNKLDSLKVVDDQIGSPTWTRDLTGLIVSIVQRNSTDYGTYHISGEGKCSWYGFAKEIYKLGKKLKLVQSDCSLNPCSSDEFPTAAKRPAFSLLSKDKIKRKMDYSVNNWDASLKEFMTSIDAENII